MNLSRPREHSSSSRPLAPWLALPPALLLAVCVLAPPGLALPQGSGYTMLPPLEGYAVTTGALDLGVTGAIVGASVAFPEAGGTWTATIWPGVGPPQPLLPLPGDPESRANGINASGRVAGDSGTDILFAPTPKRAVVWELDGTITLLALPPGTSHSSAFGVNARGQVVGRAYEDALQQAVRWEPDGSVIVLATPEPHTPNRWTVASAINNRGESVGAYHPPGPHRTPIRWDASGIGHHLETLPPSFPAGSARSINGRGEAAGSLWLGNATLNSLGAIWNTQGQLQIAEPLPGHEWSGVFGISDSGTAVGFSRGADGVHVPVKWGPGGGIPSALGTPAGFEQAWAGNIHSNGEITVFAWNGPGYLPGERAHFVLD